jgi:hypothetical protein
LTLAPLPPPRPKAQSGQSRRVGVEIEFAGLDAKAAASLVCKTMSGTVSEKSPHQYNVCGTPWGTFTVELDTQYAHPDGHMDELILQADDQWIKAALTLGRDVDSGLRKAIGDVVAGIVPTEIVSPPIDWDQLGVLTPLLEALRVAGAQGTDGNILYGFGVHLNPEIAEGSADYILAHLRAYLLLSDWLRQQIDMDLTRRILPHADPFPHAFVVRMLDPDYRPDLATLIADYCEANPTRNRGLDLFPLFAHLAPDALGECGDDQRIKARPTFHYRLPDARLSDPEWTIVQEWNRWVAVEALAADAHSLRELAKRYLEQADRPIGKALQEVGQWFESFTSR